MNWQELDQQSLTLAAQISSKPDAIVAVVRGGLIPARLLAQQRLDVPIFPWD